MDSEIMVESLPLIGVCNLCLNEGTVQSMYFGGDDKSDSYLDMLKKCFVIDISLLDLGDMKRLICQPCIDSLQSSLVFREQVEKSLKTLEATVKMNLLHQNSINVKSESDEFDHGNDMGGADDYDDDDDILLKELMLKKEPPDQDGKKAKKRIGKLKITGKKMLTITIKKFDNQDTDAMLEAGLFPFKIRKDRTFSCSICPENFPSLDDMRPHILEHSKSNIHVAFKKMIVSNSQRFFKSGKKLRCKVCTTDLGNFEELKEHVSNCVRLKSCSWNHLPFRLEKDQLDCPICKKTFLNFVRLNTHMNVHYPNFICESCGKAFASKARLRGHMRTHEIGSFACRYCDAVFDRVTKRENHVSKEHKAGVRYACRRCNITLTSFYAKQKHLAEVHNEELKRYKCKACPQSYITPGHLSSHVRRDHLNERNHKCEQCDLAFYTKNALKMHMIKHDGARIHTCSICQKSYQRKKTLREHMRIHNNDKRFVCPVCGRAFTQKCTLKGHLKVHERKVDDDRILQPLHSI